MCIKNMVSHKFHLTSPLRDDLLKSSRRSILTAVQYSTLYLGISCARALNNLYPLVVASARPLP